MATPILPILRLQEAARSSIPLDPGAKPARPAVRLQRGPFRDRPEIWALAPLDDALPIAQQKNLFAEAEDWLARFQVVLQTLTGLGISHVTAGYLVLHEREAERLEAALQPPEAAEIVLAAYADSVILRDRRATARYLPKARRQRGYATLIA